MLVARDVEVRAGARLLLSPVSFQVGPGDRVGLVGRNGAGKTTLTRILAGESLPAAGTVTRSGQIGYLPQDPRTGDLNQLSKDRILSARGLDHILRRLNTYSHSMAETEGGDLESAMASYSRAEAELTAAGGYGAEAEAARIAANLGLPDRVLAPAAAAPCPAVSGAASNWPGSCSRVPTTCCSTSRPTTWTPTRSSGCAPSSRPIPGGLLVISHDVGLLEATVNKVFHLDANRAELDVYSMDWKRYLLQRETDEKRRKRERANAERKAESLLAQADKMRAKATKAVAAQNMAKRAERLLAGLEERAGRGQGGQDPLPQAGAVRQDAAHGRRAAASPTARWRSSPTSTWRSTGAPRWSSWASTAPARPRCCGSSPASSQPDTGEVRPGHGLQLGYYAQEHETLDVSRTVLENMVTASPDLNETEVRKILGSFLFTGDDVEKPARVLSGGEKTRLALAMLVVSAANVLLLDEPTNNLDPASRAEVLDAIRTYAGAVVLVTHDEGAVEALQPDRVLLLPDGDRGPLESRLRRSGVPGLKAAPPD